MVSGSLQKLINYHVVPPVFLVLFTLLAQILAQIGNPAKSFAFLPSFIFGNSFAWKLILCVILWAFVWLWIPSKKFYGPATNFGYVPIYQANGELYYFASLAVFGFVVYFNPDLCVTIYQNMGPMLGVLNIVALGLCAFLLVKAKLKTEEKDPYLLAETFPLAHEFYRGMELHPQILGVDVKQLTNCRIGLMMWQWLILVSFGASYQLYGFDAGLLSSVLLQTIYLYKFYRWETGYFNTLDITLDRAGYYICWGCLVWVPSMYTFPSYYLVAHPSHCGTFSAAIILFLGIASIYFNYDVDRQKELFRTREGKECPIWGHPAKALKVNYTLVTGQRKETQLLISGWWGIARKINYTFELGAAFCWSCSAGVQYGFLPYAYFLFLSALLLHRIFRDEEKCKVKYGKGWETYCKQVKYRLIPYLF